MTIALPLIPCPCMGRLPFLYNGIATTSSGFIVTMLLLMNEIFLKLLGCKYKPIARYIVQKVYMIPIPELIIFTTRPLEGFYSILHPHLQFSECFVAMSFVYRLLGHDGTKERLQQIHNFLKRVRKQGDYEGMNMVGIRFPYNTYANKGGSKFLHSLSDLMSVKTVTFDNTREENYLSLIHQAYVVSLMNRDIFDEPIASLKRRLSDEIIEGRKRAK
jgi:hypothetical protein